MITRQFFRGRIHDAIRSGSGERRRERQLAVDADEFVGWPADARADQECQDLKPYVGEFRYSA